MVVADPSCYPDSGQSDGERPPRMPRWVKISLIVVAILVLLFLVLKLTGIGGQHGPGRHLSEGSTLSAVTEVFVPAAGGSG